MRRSLVSSSRGPAKDVTQADWQSAVFGYTCMIDVSARAQGRQHVALR